MDNFDEYSGKFPLGLGTEEKAALVWKIEQDYLSSNLGAISFKDEYITFAINFYTRNIYSLEDVVEQCRSYRQDERRKAQAEAFMMDLKDRMAEGEMAM